MRIGAIFGLFAILLVPRAQSAEKWADPRLPVTQGLEFWFDASRATGEEPVPEDGRISVWKDASGNRFDALQSSTEARPVVMKVGTESIVRFDGRDDFLRYVSQARTSQNVTIFIVGAPRHNLGAFAGVLALNARDQRDYLSGIALDQGPMPTRRFDTFNVEGPGFTGFKSLRQAQSPFGQLLTLAVLTDSHEVRLEVDAKPAAARLRQVQPISVAELTLGARFYENGTGPQRVQGFGAWDIAEVIVYHRSLPAEETQAVQEYLKSRYESIRNSLPPDPEGTGEALTPVTDPPLIQTFLPGFDVQELPIDLTNVNNLLYRHDGTLMALGYDGRIWALRDTDGDGLEDHADLFWDSKGTLRSPIGMDVTPPGYRHGDGVVVASKSRCVLIVDTDHDGKGDREIVVADGWKDKNHQIDAIGIAIDKTDGSIYFGRGTADYTNAYLKDKDGKAHFDLNDEMGTIQRVAPDLKSREIVATGIRFSVGLRFDQHGELFLTDQEGATWLPNGNPFDELLHIRKGKHYGFPPRHPEHLPGVIDEPSVFDYAPQHQSLCGFAFNEPVQPGGPTFGPKSWAGDAIVTGESRGKLYRTKLVRTQNGYVAQTNLIAALSMLTIDCCVAPDGSLRVACHSGGPDWGSGPSGRGKLFRIRYTDASAAQPVFAWPNGPREVRVEFDRPVDPAQLRDLRNFARLTAGQFVGAGDRFETIWPGYAVVQAEKIAPRCDVPILAYNLTPDRRTLVLSTAPQSSAVRYGLTLPGMSRPARDKKSPVSQEPQIDLAYDLTGVEAEWKPADGSHPWSGWLPHVDLDVARAMTTGSAPHESLWNGMKKPGELKLRFRLDVDRMLRPAIQPGSRLDYDYAPETVTIRAESKAPIRLVAPVDARTTTDSAEFVVDTGVKKAVDVEIHITCDGTPVPLTVSFSTHEDASQRAIPIRRLFLSWSAVGDLTDKTAAKPPIPEIAGGSWARGYKVFFGEQANCYKCHTIHGRGGVIGPDLSNLVHRDYASVMRDIATPNFALNPDHVSYVVELKSGQIMTGTVRTEGDRVSIGDTDGKETVIDKAEIESLTPSPTSLMPEGLPDRIGPDSMRDLMTFLLTDAPAMPDYGTLTPPPARRMSEIQSVLAGSPNPPLPTRNIKIVLVSGKKDHGPGEHDYPAWAKAWSELLASGDKTTVETADAWPSAEQLRTADVLIFFQQGTWNAERAKAMDEFFARGGGAVYLHYAVDSGGDPEGFAARIGLAWKNGQSKYRHGPLEMKFPAPNAHPITRNFTKLSLIDESYWNLAGKLGDDQVLATGEEDGQPQPLIWTHAPGKGRVVVSIPGHYSWSFDDPLFRTLILRSIAWTTREPVDRFDALVIPGARIAR
jgi:putative heme-binding domain-containing protein